MKKFRNFNCPNCGIKEKLVVDEVTIIKCECGKEAKRTISTARVIGNTTGKSPSFSNRG